MFQTTNQPPYFHGGFATPLSDTPHHLPEAVILLGHAID